MEYRSAAEIAVKWGISERTVRSYCAAGKLPGAVCENGAWRIPETAVRPRRSNAKAPEPVTVLSALRTERRCHIGDRLYHWLQVNMTYQSNHMEGSTLTQEQTRYIFETNAVFPESAGGAVNANDVVETMNHFRCVDYVIDMAEKPLTETIIKHLHLLLKGGTSDSRETWFAVGSYKKLSNSVGGRETVPPGRVAEEMRGLLSWYEGLEKVCLEDLLEFHVRFERIHPFQDGNGRAGRLILLKECLRYDIVPFVIGEDLKLFYYRGLAEWDQEKGYLTDTCLTAQDRFKKILDDYGIPYEGIL